MRLMEVTNECITLDDLNQCKEMSMNIALLEEELQKWESRAEYQSHRLKEYRSYNQSSNIELCNAQIEKLTE